MRRYIEIEDKIIDILSIEYIYKRDTTGKEFATLVLKSGDVVTVDGCYYNKLKVLLKPITLNKELMNIYENSINDFPGDNMIEE